VGTRRACPWRQSEFPVTLTLARVQIDGVRFLVRRRGRDPQRVVATAAIVLGSIVVAGVADATVWAAATEPAAPTGATAAVAPAGALGSGDVQLTWTAPADDGGSAITDYVIQVSTYGEQWLSYLDGLSTATTFTAHQLPDGVPQRFQIAAVNEVGLGSWSEPIEVTPLGWPAAPEGLTSRAVLSGEVQLTWSAPTDTGGTAITDYVVERLDTGAGWTTLDDGVSTGTTFTDRGLPDGTSYTFRVGATTSVGTSRWSNTVTATPSGPPAPPRGLIAFAAPSPGVRSGEVRLTWTPPLTGTTLDDYVIQYSVDDGPWTPFATVDDGRSTATSYTVGGLSNGTNYAFHVAAVNATGVGWWSETVQATPFGEPAAPTGLRGAVAPAAGLGSGEVRLNWSAPDDDGGLPMSGYVVEQSTDGWMWTPVTHAMSTATVTTVDGLTSRMPYWFRIGAVNAVGRGSWSDVIEVTPVWTPAGPPDVGAVSGMTSGEVRVSWSAPRDDGGLPITDYVVQRSTDGSTWTRVNDGISTTTMARVRGLANGTRYRFRVAAANALGRGAWSDTAIATPRWKPAAPRALRVAPVGSGQVALTWRAPASNGGSRITDYVIQFTARGMPWTTVRDRVSPVRTQTVRGLINGRRYGFRVAADNAIGRGSWSSAVRAIPRAG
jgi:hypothetical protein